MIKAIVGANWGDEGKGKITDMLATQSDIVIRFQGGSNAGHTIINDMGKFALHQLPSGVFSDHTVNIIGNGVALNIPYLLKEIDEIVSRGVKMPNIMISDRAQILMPYHVLLDQYEEERLADRKFGSTKSGIAPFYSDKYAKIGIQVCDLYDERRLMERIESVCEVKNVLIKYLYNKPLLDPKKLFEEMLSNGEKIKPFVADTAYYLNDAVKSGKNILLEGQLGALRDPDHGIFPYTTSSSTLAGYATVGAGVPPYKIEKVIAVTKAYSSAVGAGPFVSEFFGEEADELRRRGGDAGEFGATTGRPRRMGWFDTVATRYGCMVQGATEVVLTAIDCLGYLDKIPVCTGYELDGQKTRDFPAGGGADRAKPIFTYLDGFKCDIRGITEYEKLPLKAREYVEFIEREIGAPITFVSTGPKRDEIIRR